MRVKFVLFNWQRCSECRRKFILSSPVNCELCGKMLCDSCISELEDKYTLYLWSMGDKPNIEHYGKPLCKKCINKLENLPNTLSFNERYESAQLESGRIEVFSSNYKGKLRIDESFPSKKLVSRFVPDRGTIERAFQVTAIMWGFDVVYDVYYNRDTAWDGNYQYAVYQGVGIAAKKQIE